MWYRDYTLARDRMGDIERDTRHAALVATLRDHPTRDRAPGTLRVMSALTVRRVGRAVIGLANRIDARTADGNDYGTRQEAAYR